MKSSKNFLVTGATSGIGLALCLCLLEEGNVVYAAGRNESKILKLKSKYKSRFIFIKIDLTKFDDYNQIFEKLLLGKKLDGLAHCAGIEETVPLTMYNPDKVANIFNINVFSGIELLRQFSKKKYSNEGASIVFISSVMGELGQSGKIGYCSTKSAILGIVKSSSLELAKRKFRVNAVSPGVVNTPMTQKLFSVIDENNILRIKNMHPLGIGEVEDVVPMIVFLLSNKSRWITGQNIIIDGGYSIQ